MKTTPEIIRTQREITKKYWVKIQIIATFVTLILFFGTHYLSFFGFGATYAAYFHKIMMYLVIGSFLLSLIFFSFGTQPFFLSLLAPISIPFFIFMISFLSLSLAMDISIILNFILKFAIIGAILFSIFIIYASSTKDHIVKKPPLKFMIISLIIEVLAICIGILIALWILSLLI